MSEKAKSEEQDFLEKLLQSPKPFKTAWLTIFTLAVLLLLFLGLKAGIEHAVNDITLDPKLRWEFFYLTMSVTAMSALICSFFLKVFLQRRFDRDLQKLQEIAKELKDASDEVQRISQLEELSKKGRWLLNDEQAQNLEKQVDGTIRVVVTDLFFEKQAEWLEIIATNIAKPDAPVYEYFVRNLEANRNEEQHVRKRLTEILTARKIPQPQELVTDRFKVKFLNREHFPNVVFNGFAVYRFKDPSKDRCLLYFPREQWEWNVDVFGGQEASKRRANEFIAEAEAQLKALPSQV